MKRLKLSGTFEIVPKIIGDSRGYFAETYTTSLFLEKGLQTKWVQENQSLSTKFNTVRGLHFQCPPYAQTKLVRVAVGKILDVFIDIRKNSETYGEWDSIVISDELCNAVYIPHGFAHGFCTLTKNTIVQYKVDNVYSPEHEDGIFWKDDNLAIEWNVEHPNISSRDLSLKSFSDLITPFA